MKKSFFVAAALFLGLSSLNAVELNVDKPHSSVEFKVKHMQVSNVKGKFQDFSGVVDFDEAKQIPTKISGEIVVASVDTGTEGRDNHLRNADFFDAPKFPTMKFEMTKFVGDDKVKGNLTIKNVTKEVELDYDFGGITKDKNGKSVVGFSLEGKINRTDFGVGESSLMIGDEIKLAIEIEARAN